MRHPELAKYAERVEAAGMEAERLLDRRRGELVEKAEAAEAATMAYHACWVIVSYTKEVGLKLEGTNLLVVPPPPEGIQLRMPDGLDWPTGWTCGPLATTEERKAAAKAMAAKVERQKTQTVGDFAITGDAVDVMRSRQSAAQSLLRSETESEKMSASPYGPPESGYSPPIGGRGAPRLLPRQNEPLPEPPGELQPY